MSNSADDDFIIRYRAIAEEKANQVLDAMEDEIAASINPESNLISASAQVDRMKMQIKELLVDEQRFRRIRNGQLLLKKHLPALVDAADLAKVYDELQNAIDDHFNFIPAPTVDDTLTRLTDDTRYQFYQAAYNLLEQKQFNDAADILLLLTLFCPCVKVYWLARGRAEEESARPDEAIICFGMAGLFDLEDPIPHLFAAECFARQGQKDNASSELEHAEEVIDSSGDRAPWEQDLQIIRGAIESL